MKNKSNKATLQRPKSNRLLDAPLVTMDLRNFINQITKEKQWANSEHNAITIFKSDGFNIVLIGMHKNATLETNSTIGTISLQVLKGKINFTTPLQTLVLEKDGMIVLHANISYSVLAIKESFILLTLILN